MSSEDKNLLLKIRGLVIEGYSDEKWIEIVHGVDLDLHRGEVMGLIGESGAGKSTIGLASMGFTKDGCRIGEGSSIEFDGMELTTIRNPTCSHYVVPESLTWPSLLRRRLIRHTS